MLIIMTACWKRILLCCAVLLASSTTTSIAGGKILRVPLKPSSAFTREDVQEENGDFITNQHDNLAGRPGQGYYMEMQIGTPPQKLNVLVDTGSSNFAVAAAPHPLINTYFNSSASETYRDMGRSVSVAYTQGNWDGHLGRDRVSVTTLPGLGPIEANLALIDQSEGFFINGSHWQGILGLAYADVARPDSSVEPFFDSLIAQTDDVDNVFSMQLCGTLDTANSTDYVSLGGTMILGGIDDELYTPPILYALLQREWYYEVVITDFKVGDDDVDLDCKEYNYDKTIVDSGTTNLRLPDKVFERVVYLVDKNTQLLDRTLPAGFFNREKLLCWKRGVTPWDEFPTLTISLAVTANSTIDLVVSPQQYLRAVPDETKTAAEDCYKFSITTSQTGTVLGAVVMEGFYVVFDRENKTVGFAKTTCGNRDPFAVTSEVRGPFSVDINTLDCAYENPSSSESTLVIAAYVMAGVCALCLLPFIFMIIQWQIARCRGQRRLPTDDSALLDGEFQVESPAATTD